MRTLSALVVTIALVISFIAASAPAQAKQTWTVVVGGLAEKGAVSANSFFPGTLEISVGDSVNWDFRYFHTVTFLSNQKAPDLFVPEGNKLYFNPQIFFPVGGKTYDGTGYRNSGTPALDPKAPPLKYTLTFTNAGIYEYICMIHGPAMKGTIMVKDKAMGSPQAAKATANRESVATFGAGRKAFAQAKGRVTGKTAVVRLNGDTKTGYSILRFTRAPLVIKAGTTVTWEMNDPFEIHTVSFLGGTKEPEEILVEPQRQGPLKLRFNPKVQFPAPAKTYEGKGYVNSGIMFTPGFGPPNAPTSFSLTFTKRGRYDYVCFIHDTEGMKGTIIVKQ